MAALDGLGIVHLPDDIVDVEDGSVAVPLPDWSLPTGIIHAVFPAHPATFLSTQPRRLVSIGVLLAALSSTSPAVAASCPRRACLARQGMS
ncbi:MAG TPA: hypothetical protein VM422_01830 [Amaricoccus sp.]|nr:hypothetical protein [Amaricoccus sp.]